MHYHYVLAPVYGIIAVLLHSENEVNVVRIFLVPLCQR